MQGINSRKFNFLVDSRRHVMAAPIPDYNWRYFM